MPESGTNMAPRVPEIAIAQKNKIHKLQSNSFRFRAKGPNARMMHTKSICPMAAPNCPASE